MESRYGDLYIGLRAARDSIGVLQVVFSSRVGYFEIVLLQTKRPRRPDMFFSDENQHSALSSIATVKWAKFLHCPNDALQLGCGVIPQGATSINNSFTGAVVIRTAQRP